jgi:DNA-binding transcriptional regulator PaaX
MVGFVATRNGEDRRVQNLTRLCHLYHRHNSIQNSTMALPNKYQNGNIDSSIKGVYRASPVKLMIYGNGRLMGTVDL